MTDTDESVRSSHHIFSIDSAPDTIDCSECGVGVYPGMGYCMECGWEIPDDEEPVSLTDGGFQPGFPPCPGCGEPGFSVQVWTGEDETQLWQCNDEECRVHEYKPREQDPQEEPGSIGL